MLIKVLDSGGWGTEFGLVDGIHDAAVHGASVIDLSLSMAARSAAVAQAIDDAVGHGVVVVAAAGNTGNAARPPFPGAAHTLTVAVTDTTDTAAPCSVYGAFVDVGVPGVATDSTYSAGGDTWWCSRP